MADVAQKCINGNGIRNNAIFLNYGARKASNFAKRDHAFEYVGVSGVNNNTEAPAATLETRLTFRFDDKTFYSS